MKFQNSQASQISNPQLVAAMYAAIENNQSETRKALYQALIDSTLILPTDEDLRENTDTVSNSDTTLRFFIIEDTEGNNILPAFTDEDAVLAWIPEGTLYMALSAPKLFELAAQNQIAQILINPGGPVSGRVNQNEFIALAQRQLPFTAEPTPTPAGSQILIGSPATPPPSIWHCALQDALQNYAQILEAYLFELHIEGQRARLVVGIHFDTESIRTNQDQILQSLFANFGNDYAQNESVHFVALDESDFLKTVKDTGSVLYTKQNFPS